MDKEIQTCNTNQIFMVALHLLNSSIINSHLQCNISFKIHNISTNNLFQVKTNKLFHSNKKLMILLRLKTKTLNPSTIKKIKNHKSLKIDA